MVHVVFLDCLIGPPGLILDSRRSPGRTKRDVRRVLEHRARCVAHTSDSDAESHASVGLVGNVPGTLDHRGCNEDVRVWRLLGSLGELAFDSRDELGQLAISLADPVLVGGRQRDIFPLFFSDDATAARLFGLPEPVTASTVYLNGVIVCLNWLYGVRPPVRRAGRGRTSIQARALEVIAAGCKGVHGRLLGLSDRIDTFSGCWDGFEDGGSRQPLTLNAALVDVPSAAGVCDPNKIVGHETAELISNADAIFATVPKGLHRFPGFYAGPRDEYINLTVRQLRAGLLRLGTSCRGGGTVFPVGKNTGRQRAVWHGSRVSKAAMRPPAPRHLANPSVFNYMFVRDGRQLRVTKRDYKCWFDQLLLPESLRPFMGRPPVRRSELLTAGVTVSELELFSSSGGEPINEDDLLWPLSQTWPMGFSWSSYVAQESALGIAHAAGLTSEFVLAPDRDSIPDTALAFALATDDVMIFSDEGPGATLVHAGRLESSMLAHGAVKHGEKDVNDATCATCIGVDMVEGRYWWPPGQRLLEVFAGLVGLSKCRVASPAGVGAFIGVAQWFNLLKRLKLSTYEAVYRFVGDSTDWAKRRLPPEVFRELLLDMTLTAVGYIDMSLPYLGFVGATDASASFGHGAAIAPLSTAQVHKIAQLHAKSGDHVELAGADAARGGQTLEDGAHRLEVSLHDFEVVFSVKVAEQEHINLEEARALLRFVRWVLRSPRRFCHRLVVLLDSRVVIGAIGKGRSASVPLNRLLRRLAALTFASGLALFVTYAPSKFNPGDPPSRGGPATWPRELRYNSRKGVLGGPRAARLAANDLKRRSKLLERLSRKIQSADAAWARLVECGMVDALSESSADSSI